MANPERNRYLDGVEMAFFMAEASTSVGLDEPVGTIAALINHNCESAGYFALFEATNHTGVVSALLEAAEEWIRELAPGVTAICGPASLVPEVAPGLLIDGFNATPAVTTPYNPPYYPESMETRRLRAGRRRGVRTRWSCRSPSSRKMMRRRQPGTWTYGC